MMDGHVFSRGGSLSRWLRITHLPLGKRSGCVEANEIIHKKLTKPPALALLSGAFIFVINFASLASMTGSSSPSLIPWDWAILLKVPEWNMRNKMRWTWRKKITSIIKTMENLESCNWLRESLSQELSFPKYLQILEPSVSSLGYHRSTFSCHLSVPDLYFIIQKHSFGLSELLCHFPSC